MKHTYCPDLWNGFALNRRGDVFNCCHLKPFRIGNIHDTELRKLVNTPEMREYRRKSLNGELECFHRCNLVQENVSPKDFNTKTEVEYDDLRRLHISFGEACNIRCVMCNHPERHARESVILDSSVVEENIDITPFEDILIQGGEPLFIKSCLDYMAYLETMKKKYILLTNGLLIDKTMAHRLANNAKIVSISINAATKETHEAINVGSDFGRVLSNIEKLRRAREQADSSMILCGRMTLTVDNLDEIPMFLTQYRAMGFDVINFGYDRNTVPSYLDDNQGFKKTLRKKIMRSLGNARIEEIDLKRLRQLDLMRDTDGPSV